MRTETQQPAADFVTQFDAAFRELGNTESVSHNAQNVTGQTAARSKKSRFKKSRFQKERQKESWVKGLLGLGVLCGLLFGAYFIVNTKIYTPEAEVQKHLAALVAGDINKAIEIAPQSNGVSGQLLETAVTAQAKNRYADPQIKNVIFSADKAKVLVIAQQGQQQVELEYVLHKTKTKIAGLFDNWVIPQFEYPQIEVEVPQLANLLEVNGVEVDLVGDGVYPAAENVTATVAMIVTPGDYEIKAKARTEFVAAQGKAVFSVVKAGEVTETAAREPFDFALTAAGEAEITKLANAQIDDCVSQSLSVPDGCAFEAWTFVAYTDGVWKLLNYPQLVINQETKTFGGGGDSGEGTAGAAIFDFKYTNGNAGSREVKVYGDGYYTVLPDHTLLIAFNRS